jgi:hypothetical protein
MRKKTAIIIVNWNSFLLTYNCICSLQQMSYHDYDIIVIDNGSADGSGKQLKDHFNNIILIESPTNLGFAGGNNLCIQYAAANGYEYVLLLNNDTFVKEDLVKVLVAYMDEHLSIGAIQPMIYFNHNRNLLWNGGSYFNSWLGRAFVPGYNKPLSPASDNIKEVDWITGCAFFIRLSVLKQAGLFSENLFMYYEDVDLSFRIRQSGYLLFYHPGSCVYHIAGMSNKTKIKNKEGYINSIVHYLNLRNRIWLLKKYTQTAHIPTVILFNLCYIIAIMIYFTVRFRFTKLRTVIKAVKDGLKGNIIYQ